jgi:hypothetical protein
VRGVFTVRLSSLVAAILRPRQAAAKTDPPDPVHTIRFRPNNGAAILGPSIVPRSEGHHESRQASGSYLRARMFESVSRDAPRMSRRDRRRIAKQFARNEYRRMMADDTNAKAGPCN